MSTFDKCISLDTNNVAAYMLKGFCGWDIEDCRILQESLFKRPLLIRLIKERQQD